MPKIIESQPKIAERTIRSVLLTGFHILVILATFLICFAAYWLGFLFNTLFLLLLILAGAGVASRATGLYRKSLETHFVRRPFDRTFRKYLLQSLNQWLFLSLAVVALRLAIVPVQFSPGEYNMIQAIVLGTAALSAVFALVPHKRVRISVNSFFAAGWLFLGIELLRIFLPAPRHESVVLDAPFRGEWYIFQGGRSALINHHYPIRSQRHALDIIKTKDGREVQGDKVALESYPAYGQGLYAPADGRVAKVVNDRPDMPIGKTDLEQIVGNHVVLEIGHERFVLMAHLKQGSIRVLPGEQVRVGRMIAECGNSGNTSEPHLHLQVQSHADFCARDLRTFPILFRDVTRGRSGRRKQLNEADVRRNDIVIAPDPNNAHALDAPMTLVLNTVCHWRRASDLRYAIQTCARSPRAWRCWTT